MNVKINDLTVELPEKTTLAQALEARGISPRGIAVAVNSRVIGKTDYSFYNLSDGDSVIIIKAFYGG